MTATILCAVIGYLLGSIPFGYLLVRFVRGTDVRATGSGNIGATNVARVSPKLGIITLILDALKGTAAVAVSIAFATPELIAWVDSNSPPYPEHVWSPMPPIVAMRATIAALFVILGHVFPVWLTFRGGKGVATAFGAFLLLAPGAMFAGLVVFLLVVLVSRYVSLASVSAAAAFPLFVLVFDREEFTTRAMLTICAASVIIIVRHHQNIRRLLAGTEPGFQVRSQP
jgi:glycerol-3-phosphate acyltransferase PlsY